MAPATLAELFRGGRATVGEDAPLLVTAAGRRLTYGDAAAGAGRMMGVLAGIGVRRGDRVAVQVHKSPEALLLYLACLGHGAVYLPLNPSYTPAEVAHVLADAEPALLVVDPQLQVDAQRGPGGRGKVPTLTLDALGGGTLIDAAAGQTPRPAFVDAQPDDTAVLLYTSGTTGRPKGAPLTQANLGANAETLRRAWGFGPTDRLAHALPIYHAHGLLVAVNVSLAAGSSMLWFDRFDPDPLLDALAGCTVFMGVPTHYVRLLASARLTPEAVAAIRLWVSGSAPLLADTQHQWGQRTGQYILERYGMTETVMLTSNPLVGERRAGSVGLPLDGVEVRLAPQAASPEAPALEALGPEAQGIGEVQVRGPNVFAGYWRRPDLAAESFTVDGWFRTGDLGAFDPDGYLRIVGRAKDLVISGGLNVYPKEVEAVLDSLPGVAESAVVGVADPDLGEAVTAVVVAVPGAQLDGEVLRSAARAQLAGYKVPRRIHILDELPRNAMGKVEKATIRQRLAAGERDSVA
jgi:malonyl-CoA/methylmalonyl-CoA synthetase